MLRRAVASDAKKLHTLERELFGAENYPLSLRSFYYHIRRNLLLVAETEDAAIAGYVLALVRRKNAKLYSLGVSRAFRGRGIAEKLLTGVLKELAAMGFEHTVLEVRCDNTRAIALYKEAGFSVTKVLPGFYLDGCDAYWMER